MKTSLSEPTRNPFKKACLVCNGTGTHGPEHAPCGCCRGTGRTEQRRHGQARWETPAHTVDRMRQHIWECLRDGIGYLSVDGDDALQLGKVLNLLGRHHCNGAGETTAEIDGKTVTTCDKCGRVVHEEERHG